MALKYETIKDLIETVHSKVLELGVGNCKVISTDNPYTLQVGFTIASGAEIEEHSIKLTKLKLEPLWHKHFDTPLNRGKLAEVLESGIMPSIEKEE